MKFLLLTCLSFFAMSSFAEGDLEAHKAKANEHFDKKISRLNEAKTCTNSAATMEAFKACNHALQEDMKAMKKDWKKDKEEHHKKNKKK